MPVSGYIQAQTLVTLSTFATQKLCPSVAVHYSVEGTAAVVRADCALVTVPLLHLATTRVII